eukprot:Pgem_evm1s15882
MVPMGCIVDPDIDSLFNASPIRDVRLIVPEVVGCDGKNPLNEVKGEFSLRGAVESIVGPGEIAVVGLLSITGAGSGLFWNIKHNNNTI